NSAVTSIHQSAFFLCLSPSTGYNTRKSPPKFVDPLAAISSGTTRDLSALVPPGCFVVQSISGDSRPAAYGTVARSARRGDNLHGSLVLFRLSLSLFRVHRDGRRCVRAADPSGRNVPCDGVPSPSSSCWW